MFTVNLFTKLTLYTLKFTFFNSVNSRLQLSFLFYNVQFSFKYL